MKKKGIIPLLCILLLCCSLTIYAEGEGSIQFVLYSEGDMNNQSISFNIINDSTNEIFQNYLYQENGYITTIQLPTGNYHLSGDNIEETPFTVEETQSSAVKKVYIKFVSINQQNEETTTKNDNTSDSTLKDKNSSINKNSSTETEEEEQHSETNKLLNFLKHNVIYIIILIVAFIIFIIIKKFESLDKD